MAWPPDYHMHTPLCRHATGEPAEYAAQALKVGLTEIGFSEHSPMERDDFDDWRMPFRELETYVEKVRHLQRELPQLKVKLGLEIDYLPGQEAWIRKLAELYPWDYLIGSVHYISDSWAVDNPNQMSNWKGRDPEEIWTTYFARLTQAAATGLFDIIGHADLPKKFGVYPAGDCAGLFEKFLQTAKEKKLILELNTGGLRKPCQEIYPGPEFVRLMFKHGIPITFGSDAHAPNEVGMNFKEAVKLARAVGYTKYATFKSRRWEAVPLQSLTEEQR